MSQIVSTGKTRIRFCIQKGQIYAHLGDLDKWLQKGERLATNNELELINFLRENLLNIVESANKLEKVN
jgi:hypothetical protein